MFAIFGYFLGIVIWGVVWGFATETVIENKGYTENWFWWGFFFGFIALIVACAKPENRRYTSYDVPSNNLHLSDYSSSSSCKMNPGDWKCKCGRVNASYVSSCTCGKSKRDIEVENARIEEEKKAQNLAEQEVAAEKKIQSETDRIAALKEYKELMNSGIISEEEFDTKKKQLLGI